MGKQTAKRPIDAKQSAPASLGPAPAAQFTINPLLQLQRNLGNQAMLRLFQDGGLQAKLAVSQPGDPYEQEADRAAERVGNFASTAVIQRKCACGGTCSKCSEEEEGRQAPRLQLSPISSRVQRAGTGAATRAARDLPEGDRTTTRGLIVEDEALITRPGQMKKATFFSVLEHDVCATADAELAAVGRSSKSCPYIENWLAFYREQGAQHVERAILKYAPEAADAISALDYIRAIRQRVRRAVAIWARTGRVTGIPPGVGLMPAAGNAETNKDEGFGTGMLRAIAGVSRAQFKEREGATAQPTDAETVRDQLGHGRALDPRIRGHMESAFGSDFSSVRIHDDSVASGLSSQLNARAFTVGNNIAFGAGEYKPGTLVGDALIAHELAHVVQQGTASQSGPMLKGGADYDALESDADVSAIGAVAPLWAGGKRKLADIGRNATPQLKSGLRLQRCQEVEKVCPKGYSWRVQSTTGIGSFGCLCHWKCMPGEDPRTVAYTPQTTIACDPNYYCDTGKRKEELGPDYTKTGYGAAMTPLGEQAYCGCFPLNFEGKKISDAPLKPTDFEMTDIVGPLADVVAAAKAKAKPQVDPVTGKPIPGKPSMVEEPTAKPKTTITADLGVDVAVGNARAADYRERFNVGKRRNVAFADYNVVGKKGTLVGVSGEAEREGTVPVPTSPEFPTLIVGHTREFDSEKKILERLATMIGDNSDASGTVYLFSEKDVCAGCDLAIAKFQAKYPKIAVTVVSGKK